jgi:hypothetical protein
VLVFSKSGIQRAFTSPENPRALYYNPSVVVGYIPGAPVLEIAAQDPQQGTVFYTLDQGAASEPRFVRGSTCLTCHVSASTLDVPGPIARSNRVSEDGSLLPRAGPQVTVNHRTPHTQRWGGWFVTTSLSTPPYQQLGHLGNLTIAAYPGDDGPAIVTTRALVRWLDSAPETRGYLSSASDLAALLVFDHQMHAMNLLTRTAWEVRVAAADRIPTLAAVIERSAVALVDYFLFVGEAPLTAGVRGSTDFASVFERDGPRDRQGRSLKQLDLRTRLLRYPCSYMIYTEAFDALPEALRDAVYRRLSRVLSGGVRGAAYAHLSTADRRAITEILIETKAAASEYFEQPIP